MLSSGLVRIEWSPHSPPRFHDAASVFVINRVFDTGVPPFDVVRGAGGGVVIDTAHVTLRYELEKAPHHAGLTAATLRATVKSTGAVWTPGLAATGSLHGTIRTLDRVGTPQSIVCTQASHVNDTHCVEGVLSKSGWAVVDDSMGARWDSVDSAWPWVRGPAEELPWVKGGGHATQCSAGGWDRYQCIFGNRVDQGLCEPLGCCFDEGAGRSANGHATMWNYVPWCFHPTPPADAPGYTDLYLFARGRDYKGTMADYRRLSGPVPLLPRYAYGPMYSRWMGYHDFEERDIVATYERNGVPLDVMIIDMDW